jgi:hypothetical protein
MDKCSANIMLQLCGKLAKTRESSPFHFGSQQLGPSLLGCRENLRQPLGARLGAEVAFTVDADAHGVGFHFALPNHERGADFYLLGGRI